MSSNDGTNNGRRKLINGWKGVLGCSSQALSMFRFSLGILLTLELILRFRFLHPFYTDQGTLPTHLLLDRVDTLYSTVCLHCHFGSLWQQQILLLIQVALAAWYTWGYQTKLVPILCWYMYFSLTLRNTWMNYILDRYFHYLLFLSIFLPLEKKESTKNKTIFYVTPATIAVKALVVWIYIDAGMGKFMDQGWSYNADPLPALDTYARHTLPAQYLYALIGPAGLRIMTPIVVYVELLAAPIALIGSYLGNKDFSYNAIILIWSLHVGIALTLRNAALLSFVACAAWFTYWPRLQVDSIDISFSGRSSIISIICIGSMIMGTLWLETISRACDQSVKHIWSTLLHNRWNVFVGAEEYVTWEIAPGLLENGSVVDVWGRRDTVDWSLPGGGAPCTATARPGRWRSFPYLAELKGEEGEALWRYLCNEWDRENDVSNNPGRKLIKYNFFMLQADVLPEMRFSATRKQLIQTFECVPSANVSSMDEIFTMTRPNEEQQQEQQRIDTEENVKSDDVAIPESQPVNVIEPDTQENQGNEPEVPMPTTNDQQDMTAGIPEHQHVDRNEPVPDVSKEEL